MFPLRAFYCIQMNPYVSCTSWKNYQAETDALNKNVDQYRGEAGLSQGELKKLTPTTRTTLRTTPRTTLRTSPRTTLRTTLTNQPNLLSRRKELEEAYLPTR